MSCCNSIRISTSSPTVELHPIFWRTNFPEIEINCGNLLEALGIPMAWLTLSLKLLNFLFKKKLRRKDKIWSGQSIKTATDREKRLMRL